MVLAAVALVVAAAVFSYLVSGQGVGKRTGMVERLGRYVPLPSVKIVVVAWQILSQVSSSQVNLLCTMAFPNEYVRGSSGFSTERCFEAAARA